MKQLEIIKNPLTLLAIFAGLSDVAMTGVLPFLESSIQRIFMWFVMGYPLLLVCGFFYILIWKREALYAPSDFRDDATWLSVLRDKEQQILSKYPLERAITGISGSTDLSNKIKDEEKQFKPNNFYRFLRSIGLTSKDVKLIFSNVNNIANLPEVVFKITSKKEISERIKRVLNDFPQSRDDFHKLQTIFKGVD
jgi:hypothetical protein